MTIYPMNPVVGSVLRSGRAVIAAFGHESVADVRAALADPSYVLPEKYAPTTFAWVRRFFIECVGDGTVGDIVAETSEDIQADWSLFMGPMVPCPPPLHHIAA